MSDENSLLRDGAYLKALAEDAMGLPVHGEIGTGRVEPTTNGTYVTWATGGVKKEGQPVPLWERTLGRAVDDFINHLISAARAAPKGSKVYWRSLPDYSEHEGEFAYTARLFIG